MFHVKPLIYVRLDMTIPGAGSVTHLAELSEIDASSCTMLRIIELDPSGTIRGAATQTSSIGMADRPSDVVPHPDTYAQFPDIKSQILNAEEFEGLWAEALASLPTF